MKFIVVLHTDDGQRFGVTVPDLPGCFSAGDSLDDALNSALEAIDLHVETLVEAGTALPTPSLLGQLQAKPDYAGGVWAVLDAPVEKYFGPAEKINITVPRLTLAHIDAYAKKQGLSRSGFMVDAARHAMRA